MTFDGTHISVFDLKREIVLANKMGNGKDFDIKVYDNVNGEGESNLLLNLDVIFGRNLTRYRVQR